VRGCLPFPASAFRVAAQAASGHTESSNILSYQYLQAIEPQYLSHCICLTCHVIGVNIKPLEREGGAVLLAHRQVAMRMPREDKSQGLT